MKKWMKIKNSEKGFTLIELIVIIVVGAILASFLVTFMGTAITKSAVPVTQTRDLGTSIGSIETLTANYAAYLKGTMTWSAFKTACGGYITITNGQPFYNASFETIRVAITTGDQTITSYFTE